MSVPAHEIAGTVNDLFTKKSKTCPSDLHPSDLLFHKLIFLVIKII